MLFRSNVPLSRHVERDATLEQVLEFLAHRSAYQLKEADPHSWALPRLSGGPKAAMVEIQADEYGGGSVERIVGQEDPLEAVTSALQEPGFDEVIVSTLPKRVSEWLRRDLPHRIEKLGVPVTT